MNILKSKLFLISTVVFLGVTLSVIWFLYPPSLKRFNDTRGQGAKLDSDIASTQKIVTSLNDLASKKGSLDDLYDKASQALPTSPSADLLLLQLDGLTKALGLNVAITVPFGEGALVSQVAPSSSTDTTVKQGSGSVGSSKPIVTSASNSNTQFTLAGKFDFTATQTLLTKLKALIRWNNVTGVTITSSGGDMNVTITGEVFWASQSNSTLSGSVSTVLDQGAKLFSGYQSYSTVPNANTEGSFGRANPFAP